MFVNISEKLISRQQRCCHKNITKTCCCGGNFFKYVSYVQYIAVVENTTSHATLQRQ